MLAAAVLAGCGDRPALDLPSGGPALLVSSPDFAEGAALPRRDTCDGAGREPPLVVAGVPGSAREIVLVVTDPDAPGGTFVHLTRFGIPPFGPLTGKGQEGDGWTPPCPPRGPRHRYVFSVYALDWPSGLRAGAGVKRVLAAVREHLAASGRTVATYRRR